VNLDPAAALRLWAVDVQVGEVTYTIPPLPASAWLLAILDGTVAAVVPGLLEDRDALYDQLLRGSATVADLDHAAHAAVEAVSGTRWWVAYRLVNAAVGTALGAELVLRGVDPDTLPLGAWLLAAHRCAARLMRDRDLRRWAQELARPPAGVSPEVWWDEDAAAAGFEAALAAGSA
jgi:hypothetical protein